jgi:dTDP-glucose 4,6-dehydratase
MSDIFSFRLSDEFVNKYTNYQIFNLDFLKYAGNLENLKDIQDAPNYTFLKADINDAHQINAIQL